MCKPNDASTEVLLATRSPGKLREIRALTDASVSRRGWRWRSLDEFPHVPEAPEPGETFIDNARAKALFYADATGLTTLADDSGLEVDALGGAPGVHSAYYGGRPRDDAANNRRLILDLRGVPPPRRTARYRCVLVLAKPGKVLLEADGHVEGLIVDEPRGGGGFGYDPHFWLPERGCTMAELNPDEKNRVSHRGRALRMMLERMGVYFGCCGGT